jgi:hypothetical protein
MSHIRAARDRHEQNVEVTRDPRGLVVYRTLREISRGDELLVWFGDDLARQNSIPVLSPSNIRGELSH